MLRKKRIREEEYARLSDYVDEVSLYYAASNWNDWRDAYESGKAAQNPLLSSDKRFSRFCREYGVDRTIKEKKQDEFRRSLQKSIRNIVNDPTGKKLDKFEERSRRRFGTFKGKRKMMSVISKVAAFVRPERFIAWDRYAKTGLNIALGKAKSAPFKDYASYLKEINELWKKSGKELVRQFLKQSTFHPPSRSNVTFLRRVFDVALMRLGKRDFKSIDWQLDFFGFKGAKNHVLRKPVV